MTRAIRCSFAAAFAALLATAALPAAGADAPVPVDAATAKAAPAPVAAATAKAAPVPVDAATAEAAAKGEVCPAGALNAEQLQVRQQAAIGDIGRMLAAEAPPDDPEFRVLNGTGYNYRQPAPVAAPPASPAPAAGKKRH